MKNEMWKTHWMSPNLNSKNCKTCNKKQAMIHEPSGRRIRRNWFSLSMDWWKEKWPTACQPRANTRSISSCAKSQLVYQALGGVTASSMGLELWNAITVARSGLSPTPSSPVVRCPEDETRSLCEPLCSRRISTRKDLQSASSSLGA